MKIWKKTALTAVLAVGFTSFPTFAGRDDLDRLRGRIMRLQIRLQHEAETAPQVLEAHNRACAAYTEMYKRRAEVLTRLYQVDDYKDLRLALYHTQRKLSGYQEEIPVRIQRIMEGATNALAVRVRITRMEASALEADEEFVQVRDAANAQYAAYRQTLRESLDTLRTDGEYTSLVDQLANLQTSVTGMRSVTKSARGVIP